MQPSILAAAPRCGARTRSGAPCRSPAVNGNRRCRMHGGKGSGAPRGNRNAWKHGLRSVWKRNIVRYLRATSPRAIGRLVAGLAPDARLRRSEGRLSGAGVPFQRREAAPDVVTGRAPTSSFEAIRAEKIKKRTINPMHPGNCRLHGIAGVGRHASAMPSPPRAWPLRPISRFATTDRIEPSLGRPFVNAPNALTRPSVPDHVRPEKVVDFDLYRDHRFEEEGGLHEGLWRLIQETGQGIFWTPHNGGHWFITDHELLFEAAKRPDLFSSTAMTLPPMPPEEEPRLIPLGLDPPVHGAYRLPLMRAFSPDVIKAMEGGIRAFAAELIEGVRPLGRTEFVEAIAEPMPIMIFMKLMGMPLDRLREFRTWVYDMLSSDNERRASSYVHVHAMMDPLIRERETAPRDDLISRLVHSEIDGRPTTHEEVQAYCLLLFAAGLDTVANSLSFGMNLLASDPGLQERLRASPELIPEAVEEFLRRYGIVFTPRTAAHDVSFGGVDIRGGERVLLMLPAGNLDPTAFPDPAAFDIDRENKAHMTFNSGPHRCIGSHLARLELRVFYEEWLKRMPPVRIDPAGRVTYRTGLTLALDKVPIVWDAAH